MYGVGAYSDSSSSVGGASSTDFVSAAAYQAASHPHQTLAASVVNPLVGRYVSSSSGGDELVSSASSVVDPSSALSSFYAWRRSVASYPLRSH